MIITHLRATNWRNFQQIDVPLTVRQFIVGPNASGKSNLLDIFRFLQDIAKNEGGGLQEAVAGRGGVPIIRNLVTEQEAEIAIDISLADTLQRDESHRSRPAPASTARLFRCTRYLDEVRRGSRLHRNRHDTRPPKTISNKIPAATESIIGRRDPK